MNKDNLTKYELLYFQNELPVPYKLKCGTEVLIYPIKVKDWSLFDSSVEVLKLDKNTTNDVNIIQMSYLQFLADVIIPNDKDDVYKSKLFEVFSLSFRQNNIYFGKNKDGKHCLVVADDEDKVLCTINSKEFNDISDIIFYYNYKDYDDREYSEDIKKLMEEHYNIKYKGRKSPTLEEKKAYVISKTGIMMNVLNEMAYRTFSFVYDSALSSELYMADKIIQASYKYDVKNDVVHPLYEKKKDTLDEILSDAEQFEKKIASVNG